MIYLNQRNGFSNDYRDSEFARIFQEAEYELPQPLAEYAEGMGNTTYPGSRDARFRLTVKARRAVKPDIYR